MRIKLTLFHATSMIELYLIRHAESLDNLKGVWAGWRDSALSNHGMRQAEALATSLSHIPFNAIYTSDLKRAFSTAKVVHSALCDRPLAPSYSPIPLHVTSTLREQNFGVGEGSRIVKKTKTLSLRAHYAKGLFPALYSRHENFPGGENLQDVRNRAQIFIEEMMASLIKDSEEENEKHSVVGVVSHGIFIAELVAALLRRGGATAEKDTDSLRGMKNTAWTKVEVCIVPVATDQIQKNGVCNTHTLAEGSDSMSIPGSKKSGVVVNVVAVNRHSHLSNLHRQQGGIGFMAHDPKQQDIRRFLQVKPGRGASKKIVNSNEKLK